MQRPGKEVGRRNWKLVDRPRSVVKGAKSGEDLSSCSFLSAVNSTRYTLAGGTTQAGSGGNADDDPELAAVQLLFTAA